MVKRIASNEIMVTPTDKSGRFAVLSYEQYLESGHQHTSKDTEITWEQLNYLKNQVNDHMFWIRRIFNYSEKTNPERMQTNLIVSDLDVPEMAILIEDHKSWDPNSKKAVPSQPVLSGNSTVNTHLSEILAEIIEPIALESNGCEINSSEEALHIIDVVNAKVQSGQMESGENYVLDQIDDAIDATTNYDYASRMPRTMELSTLHDQHLERIFNVKDTVILSKEGRKIVNFTPVLSQNYFSGSIQAS